MGPGPGGTPASLRTSTSNDDNTVRPIPAFHFKVVIEGSQSQDTSFQEVSGIEASVETEDYTELGENTFSHKLPKRIGQHGNIVLKRGITTLASPLVTWCKQVLEEFKIPIVPKKISVHLMDGDDAISHWDFEKAYPVKWSVASFNATKNEVAIETIEFAYTFCTRNPS